MNQGRDTNGGNEMQYDEFIKSKLSKIEDSGFNVDVNLINPKLFDFQKHIV